MASENNRTKVPMWSAGLKRCSPSYSTADPIFFNKAAGWPNGKALDYESRDCRFDPCVGHFFFWHSGILAFWRSGVLAFVLLHCCPQSGQNGRWIACIVVGRLLWPGGSYSLLFRGALGGFPRQKKIKKIKIKKMGPPSEANDDQFGSKNWHGIRYGWFGPYLYIWGGPMGAGVASSTTGPIPSA